MEFQEVDRPDARDLVTVGGGLGRPASAFVLALEGTVSSGKALRLSPNGTSLEALRKQITGSSYASCRRRGLQLHAKMAADRSAIYAWCEPLPAPKAKKK